MSAVGLEIIRHDSDAGSWEFARRSPHPELTGMVLQYTGYVETCASFQRRRELPKDSTSLIISLGPSVRVIDPRAPHVAKKLVGSFVTGWWDTFAITELNAGWCGLQVDFSPVGAYQIFHTSMDSLFNEVVDLDAIFGQVMADELVMKLAGAKHWSTRFDILDRALVARLRRGKAVSREVHWAWKQLHNSGGRLSVGGLAKELGRSRKHLVAQFRGQIGRAPKLLARIIRFENVLRHVNHTPGVNWAKTAAHYGYYDQAHLVRDFQQFAGSSPTDFVSRILPGNGGISGD